MELRCQLERHTAALYADRAPVITNRRADADLFLYFERVLSLFHFWKFGKFRQRIHHQKRTHAAAPKFVTIANTCLKESTNGSQLFAFFAETEIAEGEGKRELTITLRVRSTNLPIMRT